MIHIIYGTDTEKAGDQFRAFLTGLKKKNLDIHRVELEKFNFDDFNNLISGQGLFVSNYAVACVGLLSDENIYSQIENTLMDLKSSPNICVFYEYDLDKPTLANLKRFAEKIEEYKLPAVKAGEAYNIFSLTDALGARDRKKLWVEMQKASLKGVVAEDIFWKFDDHLKKMMIVKTVNPKELNYHPFYLKKLVAQASKFSLEELKDLSQNLAKLYDQVRLGRKELDLGLEAFCLLV